MSMHTMIQHMHVHSTYIPEQVNVCVCIVKSFYPVNATAHRAVASTRKHNFFCSKSYWNVAAPKSADEKKTPKIRFGPIKNRQKKFS